ncbi:unnamed protein product [Orchesella dallaii]|uniref:Uncharacterized protein n=1 Tax=Orchesella dallaii TaxID=48710 RepID=A0ABP1PND1_9HEXA
MSTCHQAHNIPWNDFLELLHKEPYYTSSTCGNDANTFELRFKVDENGQVYRKLKHFACKIESTIKDFSKTERQKYKNEEIDKISKVYEKESCNEWLREDELQDLAGWANLKEGCNYYPDNFVGAVKELFIQEKAESLLLLARKGICLEKLQFVTYSNFFHYGVGRIKEDCLTLYIHLNLLLASGTLQSPTSWYGQWKRFLGHEILNSYDGNSQSRMYKEYFQNNPNFEDLDGLQELLKKLFRMMYVYDMIMKERGVDVSWKNEVLSCIAYFLDSANAGRERWWNLTEKEHCERFEVRDLNSCASQN